MYFIKSLPPKNNLGGYWNYQRFGRVIPSIEIQVEKLKDFFPDSPLGETQIENELKKDIRVVIENENERKIRIEKEKKENESSIVFQHEEKTKKDDKERSLKQEISEFNEEKEKAMNTADTEDDKVVAEKEKKIREKIKEKGGI